MCDIKKLENEIKQKQQELNNLLETQKQLIENLKTKPTVVLANLLHEKICRHNHTDGCSRYYHNWDDFNPQCPGRNPKKEYFKKAEKIISEYQKNWITDIRIIINLVSTTLS